MAKKNTQSGTNVESVKQQNEKSAQGSGGFGTEFASETDVEQVKQQIKQAESKKAQKSGNNQQNQ